MTSAQLHAGTARSARQRVPGVGPRTPGDDGAAGTATGGRPRPARPSPRGLSARRAALARVWSFHVGIWVTTGAAQVGMRHGPVRYHDRPNAALSRSVPSSCPFLWPAAPCGRHISSGRSRLWSATRRLVALTHCCQDNENVAETPTNSAESDPAITRRAQRGHRRSTATA